MPAVRYMASVVLENVRATFDTEVKRKDGKALDQDRGQG